MSIVSEYLDEHKEVLLRDNPGCNESWLANEYMGKNHWRALGSDFSIGY
jgi:hypothetical protein